MSKVIHCDLSRSKFIKLLGGKNIRANLCVLQAPHGRGSWNSESQGASATRAAAREFTETYQIQKGSVTIYTTLQWVTYVVPTRRQSCARKADNYVFVACAEPAYDGVNFRASTEGNLSSLHVRPVISLAVHQMDMVCSKPCGCCECSVTSTRIFLVPCCTDCWHVLRRRSPCRRRTRFCRRR